MDSEFYCKGFFAPTPRPQTPPPAAPGPGWERAGELPWQDEALAEGFRRSRGSYCRRCGDGGFALAYLLDCRLPFPLPALFCFAKAQCLASRGWWVFSFGPHGQPRFPGA